MPNPSSPGNSPHRRAYVDRVCGQHGQRERPDPQGLKTVRHGSPDEVRLSVVVPAHNEAERVVRTVCEIRRQLADFEDRGVEIVVVDDGSDDGTADSATQAGADLVLVHRENRGKGAAVRTGVKAARGQTIGFIDADLAYAPSQLMGFVEAIEAGTDAVIGIRTSSGLRNRGKSLIRSLGSRLVNIVANAALAGNYRDTQCGCKAFRSDIAKTLAEAGKIDGFAFDIEILLLIERYGFSLLEMPVEVVDSDTSTVRAIPDGMGLLRDICRIRRAARSNAYPITPAEAIEEDVTPTSCSAPGRGQQQ